MTDKDFQFTIPVQKVEAVTYILNKNDEKGEKWQSDILYFDENKLIKWDQNDFQFGQNFSQVYVYNQENVSEFQAREIYSGEKLIEKTTYIYDDISHQIKEINVQEFDDKFENAPPLEFKIKIEFDSNYVRKKDVYFNYNSKVRHEIEITKDNKGRIISHKHFDPLGNWMMTDSISYDKNGRKSVEVSSYPIPDEGSENISVVIEYNYDENGNLKEMKIEDNVIMLHHLLDKNGNWIERRSYIEIDGETNSYQIVERKITYL